MDPLQTFIVALVVVVVGVFMELPPYLTMLASLTLFSILTFGSGLPAVWFEAFNENLLTVVTSLISAMYLAELFRSCRASERTVKAFESLGPRIASVALPALVGLLPMPGGAYVSATLVDTIYSRRELRGEEKVFINFWFRHVWIAVWPLYQGVLIASYVLGWSVDSVVANNWPILMASTLAGVAISWKALSRSATSIKEGRASDLIHVWPFATIALLNLVLKLNVALSIIITVLLFVIIYRPSFADHIRALKQSLSPSVLALVVFSLIYSHTLSRSEVAKAMSSMLSLPELACYLIPVLMVFATGIEFTFSAIALPLLKNLINNRTLLLVFLGGFVGSMLSPLHLCLVLSAQYFKAELRKVYKYTVPAVLLTTLFSLVIMNLFYV